MKGRRLFDVCLTATTGHWHRGDLARLISYARVSPELILSRRESSGAIYNQRGEARKSRISLAAPCDPYQRRKYSPKKSPPARLAGVIFSFASLFPLYSRPPPRLSPALFLSLYLFLPASIIVTRCAQGLSTRPSARYDVRHTKRNARRIMQICARSTSKTGDVNRSLSPARSSVSEKNIVALSG